MKWSAAPPPDTSPQILACPSTPTTVFPAHVFKADSPSFPSTPSSTHASTPPSPTSASGPSSSFPSSTPTTTRSSLESSKFFLPLPPPSLTSIKNCSKVSPRSAPELPPPQFAPPDVVPHQFTAASPLPARRPLYEAWTLVLGALAILATIAVSFIIGSRIGWIRPIASLTHTSRPAPDNSTRAAPTKSARRRRTGCLRKRQSHLPHQARFHRARLRGRPPSQD